ncbi:MAG: hypothetical protein PUE14_05895 [Clostridia bacterium]|nr:hypothetical protein [Clostridia bacterium]
MKCPNCGKWNQANLPHCRYCGVELPVESAYGQRGVPAWQLELEDKVRAKSYIRVDEDGEIENTVDPRDKLAGDMAELKKRKLEGEQKQRQLRQEAARRGMAPSGRTVRTTSNRSTFFSAYDNPETTLRPVAPELVEESRVEPDARQVYPSKYRTAYAPQPEDEVYGYGNARRIVNIQKPSDDENIYDGYHDTSAYLPAYANQDEYENSLRMRQAGPGRKPRRYRGRRILRFLAIAGCLGLSAWLILSFVLPRFFFNTDSEKRVATVTPTIRNDLAAHTIAIPGEEGQRITIRELRTSAIVTGGVATFDVQDHVWYDDYDDYLQDTMTVTLTPYVITDSGKQKPLEPVRYEIDIPLSPIELSKPDGTYKEVSTAMYNIVFYVRSGSSVTINGEDYSDLVNTDDGKVSYNATVQPIGNNDINIVVRSQYCRENTMKITLYREKQEIPLDLASDIGTTSSAPSGMMTVRGTTLPGAIVRVLSPYVDLDITNTDLDGSFSFNAKFDTIGNNTIVITADYPGKATTRVEHVVYYVPNIDVYSRKAWDIKTQYTDLMDNMSLRKANSQIYVCKGVITSIDTTKPQRAYMNIGTEDSPKMIYVENSSRTTWEAGKYYRLYADAYGMYDSIPWLITRYTYTD